MPIGFVYTDGNAANASLGTFGGNGQQNFADERRQWDALVADLNARGGLFGQRIQPFYYAAGSATSNSTDTQQQICAAFLQDHPVRAVLTANFPAGDIMRSCLGKARVPLISDTLTTADADTFKSYPLYWEPSALRVDRIATALPTTLDNVGFFPSKARVGLVADDSPTYKRAAERVLLPYLTARGHQVDAVYVPGAAQNNAGGTSSAVSSAILRFRQDGVDQVLFLAADGLPALLFLNAADSQGYQPAYGFTSQDVVEALVEGGFVKNPDRQLARAKGVGWVPWTDVPLDANPLRSTTITRRCFGLFAKAGLTYTSSVARWTAALDCDALGFLEDAVNASQAPLATGQADRFAAAVDVLGTTHQPVATFRSRFDRSHHDGVDTVAVFAYRTACSCFHYTGPMRAAR